VLILLCVGNESLFMGSLPPDGRSNSQESAVTHTELRNRTLLCVTSRPSGAEIAHGGHLGGWTDRDGIGTAATISPGPSQHQLDLPQVEWGLAGGVGACRWSGGFRWSGG
jgi:hypothetical protein